MRQKRRRERGDREAMVRNLLAKMNIKNGNRSAFFSYKFTICGMYPSCISFSYEIKCFPKDIFKQKDSSKIKYASSDPNPFLIVSYELNYEVITI